MRIKLMKRNHALARLRARYWEFVFNSTLDVRCLSASGGFDGGRSSLQPDLTEVTDPRIILRGNV